MKEKEELEMISEFCFWVVVRIEGLLNKMGSGDRRSRFVERKGLKS